MNFRISLIYTLLFAFSYLAQAQDTLLLGQWKQHLPFRTFNKVAQSTTTVYYGTNSGIMRLDKATLETTPFTKVEGMSGVDVDKLHFHEGSKTLLIVYRDASFDLVSAEGIITVFDIKNFQGILGNKTVSRVRTLNDQEILITGNFGFSVFNVKEGIFTTSVLTGITVNDAALFNDDFYIATQEGIYFSPANNVQLNDFTTWDLMDDSNGFPNVYACSSLINYNGSLMVDVEGTLYQWKNDVLTAVLSIPNQSLNYLTADGAHLLAGFYCGDNCNGQLEVLDTDFSTRTVTSACVSRPAWALEDASGKIWLADLFDNLRFVENDLTSCNSWTFNDAPRSAFVKDLEVVDNVLYVATGGYSIAFRYLFRGDGIFTYDGKKWGQISKESSPILTGLNDFVAVRVHPETGVIYAGSFLDGLVAIDGDQYTVYNDTTSSLNNPEAENFRTRVSGLAFDKDNNLWVANHSARRPISVLTNEGEWKAFSATCGQTELLQVAVDDNGYKWFVIGNDGAGVLVFDEGDLEDATDDRCRVISTNSSNLPSNIVNCLSVDLDGDVWIGTDKGTIVFECGSGVFEPECRGSLRIVSQDDFGAYLLETENVLSIGVDGANRKWFGTESGIFIQSPSGNQTIDYLNVGNSPLLSNQILDIAFNENSGQVFIGTEKGIQSLRAEATSGGIVHASEIIVFPNPVRPDYSGNIAIKGLPRDADVKITDAAGRLVYETKSLGGQAIWDGRDYNGRLATSGTYLIFSTGTQRIENPDTGVAKLLIIR